MVYRTTHSIISYTAVISSISLVDAYNIPCSPCVKHFTLTTILKHSDPSDVRCWFTRCSTVQVQVWSLFDKLFPTHIIEESRCNYRKTKNYSRWDVHVQRNSFCKKGMIFFTTSNKKNLKISCVLILKKEPNISQIILKLWLTGNRT